MPMLWRCNAETIPATPGSSCEPVIPLQPHRVSACPPDGPEMLLTFYRLSGLFGETEAAFSKARFPYLGHGGTALLIAVRARSITVASRFSRASIPAFS